MRSMIDISFDQKPLPVLWEGDLIIVGGAFAGVVTALSAASSGQKAILVEPGTYLGREVTACLRPWVAIGDWEIPSLLRGCFEAAGAEIPVPGMIGLKLAELKIYLEDELLRAGVKLLYASQPMQLIAEAGRMKGIVIGNKSGRQALLAPAVVDATDTRLLFRFAGGRGKDQQKSIFYRTLEFDRVGEVPPGYLPVPDYFDLPDNRVRLIPGARGEGHLYVECPLVLAGDAETPFERTTREIEARVRTMALAAYLRKHQSGFESAYLASASHKIFGPVDYTHQSAEEVSLTPTVGFLDIPEEAFAGPLEGLFGLFEDLWLPFCHRDAAVVNAAAVGDTFGSWISSTDHSTYTQGTLRTLSGNLDCENHGKTSTQEDPKPKEAASQDVRVKEPLYPQRGKTYPLQQIKQLTVPVVREVDVLVIGGGTSGASAATAAARAGVKTMLVEASPGLGGTGTLGGVHSYWFGRRVGFSKQVIDAVEAMHADLGLDPPAGGLLKWNIEAKMHALLRRALEAGVEILWEAAVTGALVEGDHVRGIIAATPLGPVALTARVVIDATGDGDVAFFAGAQTVYGSTRDHTTMWYSLAQFFRPGMTKNNFTSTVDVGNVEDYTRAVLAGRRRFAGHDQGTYIAPRESRHVLGDVVLTLNDQLLKRCWPDTVYIAFSNHDVKGHSSSDWLRIGLIPPNLEVEVPYRALLPRGLEGILVAGKAISATHDALPAVRMQPDMENLGGVVGTAAALAVKTGCTPRELDVRLLQQAVVSVGALPASVLERRLKAKTYQREELERMVDQLEAAKPLYAYQDMDLDVVFEGRIPFVDLCCAGAQVVQVLQAALDQKHGENRLLVAKALAMTGARAAVPDIIAALQSLTQDEGLQTLQVHVRHVQLPPDQGAMPEAANLLYALGMTRDDRSLAVWDHFSTLLSDVSEDDTRDRNAGIFYYVDALGFGAERLGDSRAVPFLKRIHANPVFNNRVLKEGFEPDFFLERQAYLELVIVRALARCGDREGFETLIRYLGDARTLLAEHAHTELQSITGKDFGKDEQAWLHWMAASNEWRRPHPVEETNEAVRAWSEEILLPEDD